MDSFISAIGLPLGYLMKACYDIVNNYGVAIILFTLVSKILLFPLSVVVQKNAIKMVKIQPMYDEIKRRYEGDKDKIAEEQIKLYAAEKYSPIVGLLPLLIQIPLILGLINVIYNPLKHILHISAETITLLSDKTMQVLSLADLGPSPQLRIIEALHNASLAQQFDALCESTPGIDSVLAAIRSIKFNFMGIDLSANPSIHVFSMLWIIVIGAGLTAFLLAVIQNKVNVLQKEQSVFSQWGMTVFLTLFSLYFAFIVPAGVGLYWIFGNVFSIGQMFLLNKLYDPRVFIDYASRPVKLKQTKEQLAADKAIKNMIREREKADIKRFEADDNIPKQLVFYSEKSGFYKYFQNVITYILENASIVIHYVTSDPDDAIFQNNHPQIKAYYVGSKALISFMMKMDADIVVMTMPELQQYHIKRSLIRKDIEYIYMFHGIASVHMLLKEGALNHYDTIFCGGPHQLTELRKIEELDGLQPKKLIECGHGLLDNQLAGYHEVKDNMKTKTQILIAPSWQVDNICESCLDALLATLFVKKAEYKVILRPHPEFIKRFPSKIEAIIHKYEHEPAENLTIELDFSSNSTVYTSDILITDWSTISNDFSFTTKRPTIFINTTMKILNPDYMRLGLIPLDITLRDMIGKSLDIADIPNINAVISDMLINPSEFAVKIDECIEKYVYNVGSSGKVGGEYIIQSIANRAVLHK